MSRLVATSRGQNHEAVFRVVALISLALAFGVFGFIALLQTHPLALTEVPVLVEPAPVPARVEVTPPPPASPSRATEAPAPAARFTLPPVHITATSAALTPPAPRSSPRPDAQASAPAEHELAPCSQWRVIGPERVDEGEPVGTHRVRQLC